MSLYRVVVHGGDEYYVDAKSFSAASTRFSKWWKLDVPTDDEPEVESIALVTDLEVIR